MVLWKYLIIFPLKSCERIIVINLVNLFINLLNRTKFWNRPGFKSSKFPKVLYQ